ncbi:MAG TPA: aldo/keto reductase [Bacteroidales bacterium]|nr:aldo/keto reductase [Bacteroidales bacterium]
MNAAEKISGIMPVIGLGTWEMTGNRCVNSVLSALEMGYRHLDTAQIYGNEREVGTAIKNSGLRREEIFLTTKVATSNLVPARIRKSFAGSLEKLGTDYTDLLLIHWPTESMNLEECLTTMFELRNEGFVRHVGVSNFDPLMFRKSLSIGPVLTNQVKFTPYHEEFANHRIAVDNDKIITAYSPLGRGGIVKDKILENIGEKYGKTAPQISLRWLIQLGNVSVIPKASSAEHQRENMEIFDFELDQEDMEAIRMLSRKPVWY